MARVTLTEQEVMSHGSMWVERGKFTLPGADFEIETKLSNIVFFQLASVDAVADCSTTFSINSETFSLVEDDGGVIFVDQGQLTAGDYTYTAYARR